MRSGGVVPTRGSGGVALTRDRRVWECGVAELCLQGVAAEWRSSTYKG